jgi:hypothetical protein
MQKYRNVSGDSGVVAYAIHDEAIVIRFVNGSTYRYTRSSAGAKHLAAMKELARNGSGLATYISQHRDDLDFERD